MRHPYLLALLLLGAMSTSLATVQAMPSWWVGKCQGDANYHDAWVRDADGSYIYGIYWRDPARWGDCNWTCASIIMYYESDSPILRGKCIVG